MAVQQYCLRWNNHQPNFISVFSTLLHNETLVDVTLAAEGKQLQAHKVVLSACSSYFQALFTTNPCQHPIVILKDVQYNDLKTMVDFMYYGEVNVSTEQLPQILKTAEMLKIKGLAEMPDSGTVTKSESKSSVDHSDPTGQLGGGGESIWGSTESQQAAAAAAAAAQYHQQHQQVVQQHQIVQQQQRRTPTPPIVTGMSPATRRKRMRKSSTGSGSVERSAMEGEHVSSMGDGDTKVVYFPHLNSARVSAAVQNSIVANVNSRSLKESTSTETDAPQHDSSQESIEDGSHQQPHTMKTEMDITGVTTQTVPLDISGSSVSMGQTHQQHSGGQWALVDPNYSRFALATTTTAGLGLQHATGQDQHHGGNNQGDTHSSLNTSTSSTSSSGNNSNVGPSSVQMYQTAGGNYTSQIISVNPNTLVGGNYPQNLSTPTSPQGNDGPTSMQVQFSQGPTPSQSPATTTTSTSNAQVTPSAPSQPITTGTTTKRKRSVNPQGDENFLRALDAVRFGGIGFCKAARLYGVNNRTLWLEYKKRGYPISRPSIKSRIKLEPNMSPPPPSTPTNANDDSTIENYDSLPATSISMTLPTSQAESSTPLMCPPHGHPMNVMGFLDTRHVDFSSAALHSMPRQRYADGTVNINSGAVNLQGLNFNPI